MEATNNIGKPILSGLVSKIRNIEGKPLRSAIRNVRPACTNKESPPRVSPSKVTFAAHDDIRVAHASPKSASLSDVETFWDPNPTPKVLNDGSHPDVMHSSIPTGSAFRASSSFADVTQKMSSNKVVKVKELRNNECVEGAAVAIPFAEVEAVCSRFANTLYGYFIGKRLAFPLVENYVKNTWGKYGLKRIQLHEDFFLFQFNTKEGMERVGKPITLDSYTSNMCVSSWGRNTYARVLIKVSAKTELKDELVVAIPKGKDMGHSLATVSIEYEWTSAKNDGFEVVTKKKNRSKSKNKKQVDGVRLSKPTLNLHYRKVDKTSKPLDSATQPTKPKPTLDKNMILVSNSFNVLDNDDDDCFVNKEVKLSHWSWTSNASMCSKGSRIIFGVESNDVDSLGVKSKKIKSSIRSLVQGPWCILGDFNAALMLDDKLMGSSRIDISMREFKECVDEIDIMDLQSSGLKYTWNQKPKGVDGILKKIDRIMANLEFFDVFPGGHAIFQPYRISDHSPAVLLVAAGWSRDVSGFHMYKVVMKLRNMKKAFRKLMYDHGNLHENVKRLRIELDTVQRDLDRDPFNAVLREEEAVYVQAFNEAVLLEERFLRQKAKVNWLRDGDLNSAYFHKSVKSHISRSRIDVIADSNGVIYENDQVPNVFVSHYEVFLGQAGEVIPVCSNDLFQTRLNQLDANDMIRDISDGEIKDALFSMGNDKSPGPDGYTAAFFKESWTIIAADFKQAIREFFVNGTLLKELNHTIIALIPKVDSPSRVTDFRPISCCNVLFKCISKIIANRIKESLKVLVNPNQSAFIPGRSIADNILLTQELMHNYHLDHGTPRCAFKVDIQKAYDTVDWMFLKDILGGFGFHARLIGWIMECVTTTSFSISINGSLHGYFKGRRGLRQGDPLSPYLFTLVMEVLTLMLRRRIQASDLFTYHRHCSKLELVNLCFADDLFLFSHGDVNSTKVIMDSLEEFKNVSGLVPSIPKSTAYFCNVLNHVKLSIMQILPFEEGRLPVKYLGVPLVTSRLIFRDCKELIEKVQNRVDNWKNKSLSIAGRLQLIQSVIGSLHVFWASVFVLPSQVLRDIEQIMRGFLWSHGLFKRGHAKVAWNVVCLPRKEGGLGIRRLDFFNKALMITHLWKLINNKESLWVQWIHAYKLLGRNFWEIPCRVQSQRRLKDSMFNRQAAGPMMDVVWNKLRSVISKLVLAAAAYFLWQERNNRLFRKEKRSIDQVVDCIINSVRLKLVSCRWKSSRAALDIIKVEFKNYLKHKPKEMSVEDLFVHLRIEEDNKLAHKNTYTLDFAKANMVEHVGSSSRSNSKGKGKDKRNNDKKSKGKAEYIDPIAGIVKQMF
ncbi:hypothetical protein Tco_0157330 [Tanacetum coccineum]